MTPHDSVHRVRGLLLSILALPAGATCAATMETVKIAPDQKGFVLCPSGDRYVPWGHNYASVDLLERLADAPVRVEREFAEMTGESPLSLAMRLSYLISRQPYFSPQRDTGKKYIAKKPKQTRACGLNTHNLKADASHRAILLGVRNPSSGSQWHGRPRMLCMGKDL
jgi:hypothetical protein